MAFPWMAAAGFAGGLMNMFSGGQDLPDEVKRLLRMQARIARQLYTYGTGAPGTDRQEIAALAQARGLLGESQMQNREQLMALGSGIGLEDSSTDRWANFLEGQQGQTGALISEHLLASMSNRRNALLQAAGVAGGAAGQMGQMMPQQQQNFGSTLAQLAQQFAYLQALNRRQAPTAAHPPRGTTRTGPPSPPNPYNPYYGY